MDYSPEHTQAFQVDLTSSNGTNIVEVINFQAVLSSIALPEGLTLTNFCACAVESLQANYILPSITGIAIPDINVEDGESTRAAKWSENLKLAPSKVLALYADVGSGWKKRSQINLQNHGKTGIGIYSYYPLLAPMLDDGKGYYGLSNKIGVSVVSVSGSTALGTNDVISIIGSIRLIPKLLRSAVSFTGSNNFGISITSTNAIQILPSRANRKELRLTTTENIWFRFGSSGSGVARNNCAMLAKGGALTYENGRLAFEGDRGELVARSNTQGFSLWAIADNDTAVVSGEEFW